MHIAPQLLFFASLSRPGDQDLYPWADNSPLPECVRENAKSQQRRLEAQAWGSWNPVYVREPNGASSAPVLTRRCIECAAHKSCRDRYAEPSRLDWNASTPAAVPKIMEAPSRSG